VAYWIDNELLEVRDVNGPSRDGASARCCRDVGVVRGRGSRCGEARPGAALGWIGLGLRCLPWRRGLRLVRRKLRPRSILHDLEFRQFDISPDGKFLGVVEPGKRNLVVYPVL